MTPCASAQRLVQLQERAFDPNLVPEPDPMRVTPPPPEVMKVVAVVLGEEQHTLTGWQLDAAICAMSALGDSMEHIAWWLGIHPSTVDKKARRGGVKPSADDRRLDRIGIYIALLGGRIRLRGRDRDEATRLLARRGLTYAEIAHRLMVDDTSTLAQDARRKEIEVVHSEAWRCEVVDFRQRHRADIDNEELIAA